MGLPTCKGSNWNGGKLKTATMTCTGILFLNGLFFPLGFVLQVEVI